MEQWNNGKKGGASTRSGRDSDTNSGLTDGELSCDSVSSNIPAFQHSTPHAFHVMAKPTGAACNLACDYCFFLKKDRLYPGSRFRMSDETMESYVRQSVLRAHRAFDEENGGFPEERPLRRRDHARDVKQTTGRRRGVPR